MGNVMLRKVTRARADGSSDARLAPRFGSSKPEPDKYTLGAWLLIIAAWIALAITVVMTFEKTRVP